MERDADDERLALAVVGASGRTGRLMIEGAIATGYEVRAFVHDRSRLPLGHDRSAMIEDERHVGDFTMVGD